MRVVSIFNMKGGVGKTAAAVNLGYIAASQGVRVLIWDLDPQAATSFYFRIKPKIKGGSKKLVRGKSELDSLIKGTDFNNLDLLPSDFTYRNFDVRLAQEKRSHLKRLIAPLREEYDLVIFDCPPGMSELSEQIFRASNVLLVPIIPTTLSIRTLEMVQSFLKKQKIRGLKVRTFFSMVDRRKKMHRSMIEAHAPKSAGRLRAYIPNSTYVERMGIERRPVAEFAPRSTPAAAFRELWREIQPLLS